MSLYLPIRAFNRSQQVRIGGSKVKPDVTAYIDISDVKVRKELAYHSSIGAVYPVGPVSNSNSDTVFEGVTVDEGSNATDLIVQVNNGRIYNRNTGVTTVVVKDTALTISTAHATLVRIDIVQVATATGVATKKDGTASATPVAPAPDAGNITVAQVNVPATDTAITTDQITDVAPRG